MRQQELIYAYLVDEFLINELHTILKNNIKNTELANTIKEKIGSALSEDHISLFTQKYDDEAKYYKIDDFDLSEYALGTPERSNFDAIKKYLVDFNYRGLPDKFNPETIDENYEAIHEDLEDRDNDYIDILKNLDHINDLVLLDRSEEKKENLGLFCLTTFVIAVLSYLLFKPETISITSFLIILYSIIKIFRRQIICFFRGLIITRRKMFAV